MALKKDILKPNGLTLSYHRISMAKIEINQQITILVESYLNGENRNYEKQYAAGEIVGEPTFPYTQSEYINLNYDENMDLLNGPIIQKAYDWLKEQPAYIGSEDV